LLSADLGTMLENAAQSQELGRTKEKKGVAVFELLG